MRDPVVDLDLFTVYRSAWLPDALDSTIRLSYYNQVCSRRAEVMASEFNSVKATEIDTRQLAPPGPVLNPLPGPIPSFQDLTDSSGDENDDEQDWESIIKAGE